MKGTRVITPIWGMNEMRTGTIVSEAMGESEYYIIELDQPLGYGKELVYTVTRDKKEFKKL